jgi:hypothetical protein
LGGGRRYWQVAVPSVPGTGKISSHLAFLSAESKGGFIKDEYCS